MGRAPTLTNKLAAALLQSRGEDGALLIPYEHAKLMSDDQVISLFEFDHYPIRWVDGGPTAGFNLVPRLKAGHSFKTNVDNGTGRGDKTDIARDRKIAANHEAFRARLLAPDKGRDQPKPRSSFPQGRKLQSRSTFRRRKP